MTNPNDPNSPPIPVPETMEEFREMARAAMALAARTAASLAQREVAEAARDKKREAAEAARDKKRAERDKQQAERDKQQAERDKQQAERDKQREALEAKREARLAKTERLVNKLSKLAGGNDRNTGRSLEQEVIARVKRDGKIAWMRADEIYPNLKKIVNQLVLGEYDLVIVNGAELMVVEVKRVLRAAEVRKFVETDLAQFRARFPEIAGDRVIYGAVAFALEEENPDASEAAMRAAQQAGLLLIRAVGKTGLEFLNPARENLRAVEGGPEKQPR